VSATANGEDRLAAIHSQLLEHVTKLVSSQEWRSMLTVASRFHTYSPNNVLLIAAQRPDATRVAGYRAWAQLGRQVRKGETGIAILAPVLRRKDPVAVDSATAAAATDGAREQTTSRAVGGFRVTHVFDVSQTDGPDLPDVRPELLSGGSPLGLWSDLYDQIEAAGYSIDYADLGEANGRTDFTDQTVVLHTGRSGAQLTKTLAHELAHIDLHAPDVRPEALTRPHAEVEAESVAYIVTAAHGLGAEDYSVPHVTGWAGGDVDMVTQAATRVLSCARTILRNAPPSQAARPEVALARDLARATSLSATLSPAGRPTTIGRGTER
jgi:antirestriction protein ArdC